MCIPSQALMATRKRWRGLPIMHHFIPILVKLGLFALVVRLLLVIFFANEQIPYIASSSPKDPFTNIKPDFLNDADFDQVTTACKNHALTAGLGQPDVYPETTQGWVAKFNLEGLTKLKQDARFSGLNAFMEKILDEKANAFVVRFVVGGSMAKEGDPMVARHRDENAAIKSSQRFTPNDVNVLYLATPPDMLGGELVLWPGLTVKKEWRKQPAVIWPVKNVLVTFRGDSDHKVRGFKSDTEEKRVSLVVEQYRIPKGKYHLTVDFCLNSGCP